MARGTWEALRRRWQDIKRTRYAGRERDIIYTETDRWHKEIERRKTETNKQKKGRIVAQINKRERKLNPKKYICSFFFCVRVGEKVDILSFLLSKFNCIFFSPTWVKIRSSSAAAVRVTSSMATTMSMYKSINQEKREKICHTKNRPLYIFIYIYSIKTVLKLRLPKEREINPLLPFSVKSLRRSWKKKKKAVSF